MYNSGFWIEENIGNNAFSWEERQTLGSQLKIYVPSLIGGNLSNLQVGENIAFEEISEKQELQSHVGLKYFVKTEREGIPVYIVDNHNHVLYFRYKFWLENQKQALQLIHIDQHTDMNTPPYFDNSKNKLDDIFNLVNHQLNVGNFIVASQKLGIVNDVIQINTEYTLNQCLILNKLKKINKKPQKKPIIVDIDMDFWAPDMGIEYQDRSFGQIRKLCRQADLITLATSPYFIDQELAIELVKRIFLSPKK